MAEAQLGVVLPHEYREFVQNFGAGLLPGVEIFGLPDPVRNNPPIFTDVIALTKRLRQRNQAGAERPDLLPISEDGTGIYFFISGCNGGSTEVIAIGPGVEQVIAPSFQSFVVGWAERTLSLGDSCKMMP